ncbi:solute carrier family 46 member 3 [Spea bombifrons]|uniref:solute carrier family 46 member 3 n=1 Tax=Spea bombifrons TaxID=233779 RepID=UPI0023491D21|nr:solute carrier family 46 member 3 [Spea bombifrons]XP_053312362.1 solute carrier family 46 member 3 [Spea bombifrons]
MKQFRVVEPVVALYCFASFVIYPISQLYIYQRLWKEEFNSSVPYSDNVSQCETNQSSPSFIHQKEVQRRVSYFTSTLDLSGLVPSLVMSLILVSYGDRHGRKASLVLPSVGGLLSVLVYFATSFFSLPLEILYASSLISGFLGSFATFLGGCFSYVADIAKDVHNKNTHIAFVDMILGVASGIAGIASGYMIKELGFELSFAIPAILYIIVIFYIIFFLEETVKRSEFQQHVLSKEGFKELFLGVFLLFKHSSVKKRVALGLLLFAFNSYLFANFGATGLFTLYELDTPLCWDAVLIGWGSALSTFCFVTSFLGIYLFSRCLKDPYIVFIGVLSGMIGITLAAFARTTVVMMLVRIPILFAAMPLPVLRSMMSKVVLEDEQGALFACIACLECITGVLAISAFKSVYASTVMWFPGFSFLLSAGLCLIPIGVVWFLVCIGYQERDHTLIVNEEVSTEEES